MYLYCMYIEISDPHLDRFMCLKTIAPNRMAFHEFSSLVLELH